MAWQCMVYGMTWQFWQGIMHGLAMHGIWYDLAVLARYNAWPGNAWHGIWNGLAAWHGLLCMAWYTVWHYGHGMVYSKSLVGLLGMECYMLWSGRVKG